MNIEKSRNGYYTLTFFNKNNLDEKEIIRLFNTVGNVCKVVQNFQRVFIRFKEKEEAERALKKFGKVYNVDMAKNDKLSDGQQHESTINQNTTNPRSNHSYNHKPFSNQVTPLLTSSGLSSSEQSIEKLSTTSKMYHLILGNLPKNYTVKDVNALIEEAKPVHISQLDETRVFNIKFCHVVLDSADNLTYLIDKLNGFVIGGEKLVATEVQHLLEWRGKALRESRNSGRMVNKRYQKIAGSNTGKGEIKEADEMRTLYHNKWKEMSTIQGKAHCGNPLTSIGTPPSFMTLLQYPD